MARRVPPYPLEAFFSFFAAFFSFIVFAGFFLFFAIDILLPHPWMSDVTSI